MSDPGEPALSAKQRVLLNDNFREAIRVAVQALCDGQPKRRSLVGPYVGGYLPWPHLAELISEQLRDADTSHWWDPEEVRKIIQTGDRALPKDPHDRQIFLQVIQRVINTCFDMAEEKRGRSIPGKRCRYIEFLGTPATPASFRPFNFDPSNVGLFRIIDWNAGRRLDPDHNIGEVAKVDKRQELMRHHQEEDWVDPGLFRTYLEEERGQPGSPCPTLVGYDEDTRETGNDTLRLRVALSMYYEHVAVRRYLRDHPDAYDAIVARISHGDQDGGLSRVIRASPNSNIVINVTAQSRNGKVMMLRRPIGARVWPGFYQVGAHETMNWSQPGSPIENCHQLAVRALREELGLTNPKDYYNNIVFSWFGSYVVEASGYFFAHVKTPLEEDELVTRVTTAENAFEVEDVDWYDLDRPTVTRVLGTWQDGPWTAGVDEAGRQYLPHATMSLTQLWRVTRQRML
ncbi:hypothetical protein [Streptomyces sp. NBC_00620]|uniref:hypothetical protein n=1 Tax=Streptomyces sp. NBC_00620 TaxID=2903666 RepID=UPI00224D609D|nr:hypothetical protein [Streptomyces sp. NBC_00620]MCX4971408.1 hypothetical protein [Streptomyces sp. NBC_00620]